MNVVIIGQGNVGSNLMHGFTQKRVRTQMVSSREGLNRLPIADVYIYAVRDEALLDVVQKVTEESLLLSNKHLRIALHLHTSGTMPVSVPLVTSPLSEPTRTEL